MHLPKLSTASTLQGQQVVYSSEIIRCAVDVGPIGVYQVSTGNLWEPFDSSIIRPFTCCKSMVVKTGLKVAPVPSCNNRHAKQLKAPSQRVSRYACEEYSILLMLLASVQLGELHGATDAVYRVALISTCVDAAHYHRSGLHCAIA